MNWKKYFQCWKWQILTMRDPYDPMRDFKERMRCLFSDEKDKENKEDKKNAS